MLKKKYRLDARIRLFQPQTKYSPFFLLKIAKNSLSLNRYGFIVGKKVDKRAVARNRIKRRMRAAVEALNETLPQGYDMLFIAKQEAIAGQEKLREEVVHVLKSL